MNAVHNAVATILGQHPNATNEEVAAMVRQTVPGAQTTAASVSSIKSRMKKIGFEPAALDAEGNPMQAPTMPAFSGPLQSFDRYGEADPNETEEQAAARISRRYMALDRMATRIVEGYIPSLIVSGPPGLGKSFTIMKAIEDKVAEDEEFQHDVIRGAITAVGLYIALWNLRDGGLLVLDDCDDVFRDETALNLLKAVLDSNARRRVSWRKRASWLDELGIDDSFDFCGSIVFLTNVDFEAAIAKGNREGKHFEALMDRSMYLCLTLRARRDFIIRIRQVCDGDNGMLSNDMGLNEAQRTEVLDYMEEHQTRFYNLSLRLVRQIAQCYLADPDYWKGDVEATKMKTV